MSADTANKLHPQERLVLKSLEHGEATDKGIAAATGLPVASVNKAGLWLKLKGLIEYRDRSEFRISLTQEGRNYAKSGLPEKLLLRACEKESGMDGLRKKIQELNIALAWAKKNGWIDIGRGKIKLTSEGKSSLSKKTSIEKALETGETTDEAILQQLKARRLVTVTEMKEKTFMLTPKGRGLIPNLAAAREEIGQLTPNDLKTGKWREKRFRPYDISTPVPTAVPAKIHPYVQFINYTRQKLIALGFREVRGPYVELEFWNSDALFMPQDHPARGIHDVFRIKNLRKGSVKDGMLLKRVSETHRNGWTTGSSGWGAWNQEQTLRLILRSQTTAVSARTLGSGARYGKFFTIDRNFRPDVIDATHSMEFHQCEGIVVGEGMNLRHLLGYLRIFGKEIAGAEEVRFRPGYVPFTEPSVELDGLVNGKWMELAGAGIFRPEVTRPLGVSAPVLAWGIGFGRLAMIKLGITDLRDLFNHDLEWLKNRRLVY
jgi:phenylalanyl-tRNA synthetase alpha chain